MPAMNQLKMQLSMFFLRFSRIGILLYRVLVSPSPLTALRFSRISILLYRVLVSPSPLTALRFSRIGILLYLILIGCAGINHVEKPLLTEMRVGSRQGYTFQVAKAMLEPRSGVLFLLEQGRPNIYFYQNNKQIFSLGGFGVEKSNFQKLSDFTLDPDGNLLVLDSFSRLIRKYSSGGLWLADIELKSFLQPEKLCSTPEGDLLIYDAAPKEIYRISGFDRRIIHSFGKFQIETVAELNCNREFIWVINATRDQTVLYTAMGQYVRTYPAQVVMDRFSHVYAYQDGCVLHPESGIKVPFGWQNQEVKLLAQNNDLFLLHENDVISIDRIYQDR
jgi:hypothetical protein